MQQSQDHAMAGGIFLRIKWDFETQSLRTDWSRDGRGWNTFSDVDIDAGDTTMTDFNGIGIGSARRAGFLDAVDFSFFRAKTGANQHGVKQPLPAGEVGGVPTVLTTISGAFRDSLTVSGEPVLTAASETGPWYTTFTMQADATQAVANEVTSTVSSITETVADHGGFTVAAGVVEVPTGQGYTHVRLQGQLAWEAHLDGFRQTNFVMNGETIWKDTNGDKVLQQVVRQQALVTEGKNVFLQIQSAMVAVSGGTQFSMSAYQDSGVELDIIGGNAAGASGTATYLQIEGFKKVV
jgi:hypothetical protein